MNKYPKLEDAVLLGDVEISNSSYYVGLEVLILCLITTFFIYVWWGSI